MKNRKFEVLSIEEVDEMESPGWLIEGIMPAKGLVQVYGREAAGKTFVVLDMALRIAAGMSWSGGRAVRPGKVVYVAGEGLQGLKKRIHAWRLHHEVPYEKLANFWLVPEPVQLGEENHVNGIVESIAETTGSKEADLIVFDTQARCTTGLDENSAEDMGIVVAALDWIRAETGGAALVIHHSPYKETRGRGSSSVPGALDTAIGVRKKGRTLTLTCSKQKDWEEFEEMRLGLATVEESAVVVEAGPGEGGALHEPTPAETVLLEALAGSETVGGVSISALQADWPQSRATFYRALKRLKESGLVNSLPDNKLALAVAVSDEAKARSVAQSHPPKG